MGFDSAISIGSSLRDSNDSDATLPMISDTSPPGFNRSDTTISSTSDLDFPDSNKSDATYPRVSEFARPNSDRLGFVLPKLPILSRPHPYTFDSTLPRFSNPLSPKNSSTQLRNYPNLLVPNNFRPPFLYKFGPIVENYSGITDQRNLRLSIPDGHTLDSGPPIPPKQILSQPCLSCSRDHPLGPSCNNVQPCFECVKSNKFCSFPEKASFVEPGLLYIPACLPYYQSRECSRDSSDRHIIVMAVKNTTTTRNCVDQLRCNNPTSHNTPEHELTDQVAGALMVIPSIPHYIFFRYYFQGREVWPTDCSLVRDLKWENDDYKEVRAFNLHTGLECHACMEGWYRKSV